MGQKTRLQSKNTAFRGEDGGILKLANGRDNFLILRSVAFPVHQTVRVKMQKQLPRKAFPFHMTCDLFVNGCLSDLPAASGNVRCGLLRYLMTWWGWSIKRWPRREIKHRQLSSYTDHRKNNQQGNVSQFVFCQIWCQYLFLLQKHPP